MNSKIKPQRLLTATETVSSLSWNFPYEAERTCCVRSTNQRAEKTEFSPLTPYDPNFLGMIPSATFSTGCGSLFKCMDHPPRSVVLTLVKPISMEGPWREIPFQPGRMSEMQQWDQPGLKDNCWEHSSVPAQSSTVTEGSCPMDLTGNWQIWSFTSLYHTVV